MSEKKGVVYYPSLPGNEEDRTRNMFRYVFKEPSLAAIVLFIFASKRKVFVESVRVKGYEIDGSQEEVDALKVNELGGVDMIAAHDVGLTMENRQVVSEETFSRAKIAKLIASEDEASLVR
jgi:hypothetical protein